jgi:hypothetical protein
MDTLVERRPTDVLRVRADMHGSGPRAAFGSLESKLRTLRCRKFFGTIRLLDEGEEYYACVEKLPGEDAAALGLDSGTIPGGTYIRRRVWNWESAVAEGRMKEIAKEFAEGYELDPRRPSIEFYRSVTELHIMLPLARPDASRVP